MRTGNRRVVYDVPCVEVGISDILRMQPVQSRNDVCNTCPCVHPDRSCSSSCSDGMVWVPITIAAVWALEE